MVTMEEPLLQGDSGEARAASVHSSSHSIEGSAGGHNDALAADDLAELTRTRDVSLLRAMGGTAGVFAVIDQAVAREVGDDMGSSGSADGARRRLFGRNDLSPTTVSCGFFRLWVGCLIDDQMIVLFASGFIALALGLIQCVPISVDIPRGDVHLRRCPTGPPLWASHEPVPLPSPARHQRCGAEAIGILLLGALLAGARAAGEWWRQRKLLEMLGVCRTAVKATVTRAGQTARVLFEELLVGDMVVIGVGDIVPADGVLLTSRGLTVDESAESSGEEEESQPRAKNADSPFLLAGSVVLEGEGRFLVTSVGQYSHWETMTTLSLGSKLAKLVRDPVPLRRPLDRVARLTIRCGQWAVAAILLLRTIFLYTHLQSDSCFDGAVEKCAYGKAGLNNRTLCVEQGYRWQRHVDAPSALEVWPFTEAVMNTTAFLMLLVPHGLNIVLSALTASSLSAARRQSVLLQSLRALDMLGRVTSMCVNKSGLLSPGPKILAMAHICGAAWPEYTEEVDSSQASTGNSHSPGQGPDGWLSGQGSLGPSIHQSVPWVTRLHRDVVDILCEGFVFNSRACLHTARTRGPDSGIAPTQDDYTIDAAVHAALAVLGCDTNSVFRTRQQAVLRQWPFAKATQRASVLLSNEDGSGRFYASGAAQGILDRCSSLLLADGSTIALSDTQRVALNHVVSSLPHISLNGIALAFRRIPNAHTLGLSSQSAAQAAGTDPLDLASWLCNLEECEKLLAADMVFVGILAFKNQLAADVPRVARVCEAIGVTVRVVTGEALESGKSAALACGLLPDGAVALTGAEWNRLTAEEQSEVAPAVRLLAEASPADKAALMRCLRASDEIVGACIDCLDDEPVRQEAHVSVCAAHQAQQAVLQQADVVCLDDNFSSLLAAVVRGRRYRSSVEAYVELRVTFSIVVSVLCVVGAAGGIYVVLPEQMLVLKVVVDVVAVLALAPNTSSLTVDLLRMGSKSHSSIEPFADDGLNSRTLVSRRLAWSILALAALESGMLAALLFTGPDWVTDCTDLAAQSGAMVAGVAEGGSPQCYAVLANGQSARNGWREEEQHYLYSLIFNAFVLCQIAHLVAVGVVRGGRGLAAVRSLQDTQVQWLPLRSCDQSTQLDSNPKREFTQARLLPMATVAAYGLSLVVVLVAGAQAGGGSRVPSPWRSVPIDAAGWCVCAAMACVTFGACVVLRLIFGDARVSVPRREAHMVDSSGQQQDLADVLQQRTRVSGDASHLCRPCSPHPYDSL